MIPVSSEAAAWAWYDDLDPEAVVEVARVLGLPLDDATRQVELAIEDALDEAAVLAD